MAWWIAVSDAACDRFEVLPCERFMHSEDNKFLAGETKIIPLVPSLVSHGHITMSLLSDGSEDIQYSGLS